MIEVEYLAVLFTILSVYLTYKSNILCWPFGIIGIVLYLISFKDHSNWINMSVQLVLITQSFIGWFKWSGGRKISYLDNKYILLLVFPIWSLFWILSIKFGGNESILDSLTSSLALFGVYLTSNRKIESWLIWGLCDLFLIVLFYRNEMFLSSLIYFIFLIICIFGFYDWKRKVI